MGAYWFNLGVILLIEVKLGKMRLKHIIGGLLCLGIMGVIVSAMWYAWQAETVVFNQQSLTDLVTKWESTRKLYYFSNDYWDANSDSVIWNEIRISKIDVGYEIFHPNQGKVKLASLAEVSLMVNATSDEILFWKEATKRLGIISISTIGTTEPVQAQFIEILLDSGFMMAFQRVGFLYVPEGHETVYRNFLNYPSKKEAPPHYKKINHLDGRWFYFKAAP